MPRTLTAMFDTRAAAEATLDRLVAAGVSRSEIDLQDAGAYAAEGGGPRKEGLMAGIRNMFGDHDDHHAYAEGVSRGQVLLSATVQDTQTDAAIQVLEGSDAVDLDSREAEWRQAGWAGRAAYAQTDQTAAAYEQPVGRTNADETIQLAEERLVVGKREVDRGGVRVRSYIVETPVSEQVSLRQETVGIDQRPVNRAVPAGEDAFRDRVIEMRETGEEAVVGKEAFVTEEIALRKDVGQRTEEVRDSVRHTEVEVERVGSQDAQAPARSDPAKR